MRWRWRIIIAAASRSVEHSIEIFHLNCSLRMISFAHTSFFFFYVSHPTHFPKTSQNHSFCGFVFFILVLFKVNWIAILKVRWEFSSPYFLRKKNWCWHLIVLKCNIRLVEGVKTRKKYSRANGVPIRASFLHQNVISFNAKKAAKRCLVGVFSFN